MTTTDPTLRFRLSDLLRLKRTAHVMLRRTTDQHEAMVICNGMVYIDDRLSTMIMALGGMDEAW